MLGIPEGRYLEQAPDEALQHFRATCAHLVEAGYSLVTVPAMPDFAEIKARQYLIVAAEAAAVHRHWYAEFAALYHPRTVELIERGRSIAPEALAAALRGRKQLRAELTHLMNVHGVDLWLAPSAPGAAPRGLDHTGDPVMNLPWTQSGLPAVSVPSGPAANGLPLGLQLIGRWQADELLLHWAAELEPVVRQVRAAARPITSPGGMHASLRHDQHQSDTRESLRLSDRCRQGQPVRAGG
jgi:Asp-tRNA(Asn)/Glu-tRNA(Gln) amidotransferase A subunit family amidase